jgi:hypothetical protein
LVLTITPDQGTNEQAGSPVTVSGTMSGDLAGAFYQGMVTATLGAAGFNLPSTPSQDSQPFSFQAHIGDELPFLFRVYLLCEAAPGPEEASAGLQITYQIAPASTIKVDSIKWHPNPDDGGGVTVAYTVSGAPLPKDTTVALYWAHGPTAVDAKRDAPVFEKTIPTGTSGSHSFHVIADDLKLPPQGIPYLLAVADPHNDLGVSNPDDGKSLDTSPEAIVAPVIADDGSKVRSVRVLAQGGAVIVASFQAAGGALTLEQAAALCRVDHFNWIQTITAVPPRWIVARFAPDGTADAVFFAPPDKVSPNIKREVLYDPDTKPRYIVRIQHNDGGQGVTVPDTGKDNHIFLFNDPPTGSKSPYVSDVSDETSKFVLSYLDKPEFEAVPDEPYPFPPGESVKFLTQLAGVKADGSNPATWSGHASNFTWRDNAVHGAGGGVLGFDYLSVLDPNTTTPPPVISGGVFDVQYDDQVSLAGPSGYGPQGFIPPSETLPYQINFENPSAATAPVQKVVITNQLDANLDWGTFQLTGIGFGSTTLAIPAGSQSYQKTVPMTYNGTMFNVQVQAQLNATTGLLTVTFQSIDPGSGLPPAPAAGFLPPEDGTGRGVGFVSYSIQPKTGLVTGTQIRNIASVTLDSNPAIATDQVDDRDSSLGVDPNKQALVTIDAGAPTSSVQPLPAVTNSASFTVSWSGQDDPGGSGIASYSVYVSDNGGAFKPFLTGTTRTSATFTGQVGHTYGFYSVATDNVGNRQPTPAAAQATTLVAVPTTTALSSDHPGGSADGQVVVFTATVGAGPNPFGTPTGSVQFQIDGANFGPPIGLVAAEGGTGVAVFAAVLGPGAHSITAVYSGDGKFQGSAAAPIIVTVSQPLTGDVTAAVQATLAPAPTGKKGKSRNFTATLTVRNSGGQPIEGPLSVVLRRLRSTARLRGAGGFVGGKKKRSPYVVLSVPGGVLQAGDSVSMTLQFSGKPNQPTLTIFAGSSPR